MGLALRPNPALAEEGTPALVRLLLDHGADKSFSDRWDRRALTYALRRGADDPIAVMLMGE